jgi:DNA-binding NarL/FixJ family response regulator
VNPRCQIVACDAALELFGAGRDGTSGGDLLARAAPDVLLVDLGLPHVSGIER